MLFHVIKQRKNWYIISLAILILGVGSLLTQGLNLGIDFTGGNIVELRFDQPVAVQDVRDTLAEFNLQDSRVQSSGENTYLIRTKVISQEESDQAFSAVSEKLGGATVLRNELVGPVIGKELTKDALLALGVAGILMVIYISWRFEFLQGVAAIAAILHDVLVMVGMASLLQIEIESFFVAAVLTIVGYSINGTIIIFDRVRENLRLNRREDLAELVNKSVWQTMGRAINTNLTVVIVLLALIFLGGHTIQNFVALLLVGVLTGTYTSIFISSTLWYDLRNNRKKRNRTVKSPA
ncbi:protein translocase subunit SecF [Desulforamulus aquiferis]|uniref:Protein-export membrane protein SecF n=1 Tax=Desulforamulus aquiferis TaxID=1397668 RepID=A0AAW7ZJI5_9FIRM|nr:protein translocase subunit SecF [Desulforamulus aquiferis]MDO7788856.1 protein translocase subunit SecF [Desulforamulus aquiferis]